MMHLSDKFGITINMFVNNGTINITNTNSNTGGENPSPFTILTTNLANLHSPKSCTALWPCLQAPVRLPMRL